MRFITQYVDDALLFLLKAYITSGLQLGVIFIHQFINFSTMKDNENAPVTPHMSTQEQQKKLKPNTKDIYMQDSPFPNNMVICYVSIIVTEGLSNRMRYIPQHAVHKEH